MTNAHLDNGKGSAVKISVPWLIAFVGMTCFIWGNSLVPGDGSGSLSLAVLEAIRSFLGALHIPDAWVTHMLVRKAAHFSENMVLAIVGMQAFRPHLTPPGSAIRKARIVLTVCALVAVPCIDETIQLFVDGRSGQVTDVLIDCAGAATGALLTLLVSHVRATSAKRARDKSGGDGDAHLS